MIKNILIFLGLVIGTLILSVILLFIGANIGGNYLTSFELFGLRGYEATGMLGFYIGIVTGSILSVYILLKMYKKTMHK